MGQTSEGSYFAYIFWGVYSLIIFQYFSILSLQFSSPPFFPFLKGWKYFKSTVSKKCCSLLCSSKNKIIDSELASDIILILILSKFLIIKNSSAFFIFSCSGKQNSGWEFYPFDLSLMALVRHIKLFDLLSIIYSPLPLYRFFPSACIILYLSSLFETWKTCDSAFHFDQIDLILNSYLLIVFKYQLSRRKFCIDFMKLYWT